MNLANPPAQRSVTNYQSQTREVVVLREPSMINILPPCARIAVITWVVVLRLARFKCIRGREMRNVFDY